MTNRERAKAWLSQHMQYMPSDLDSLAELLDEQEARIKRPFQVVYKCSECKDGMTTMQLPVSLWRCEAHPSEHQSVGPEIAFEISEQAKTP